MTTELRHEGLKTEKHCVAKGEMGEINRDLSFRVSQIIVLKICVPILPMDLKSNRKPIECFN